MGIECMGPTVDCFKKSLWQRIFDDPSFVRSELVQLPRKMSGKEILDAGKKLEVSGWEVSLLPYENGLSITGKIKAGKKIRFVLDLSESPGGSKGPFRAVELVGDWGDAVFVPLEPKIVWDHLKEVIFEKIYVMFFKVSRLGGCEKRICWKFPKELYFALSATKK